MTARISPKLPETGLRYVRGAASLRIRRRWDVRERGTGHVPTTGAVILASNHIGWFDGPLLLATAPRPIHALVEAEMYAGKTGRLLNYTGQIKVKRGVTDAGAVRSAIDALSNEQAVAIFAEGKRGDGEFASIKRGIGYLALISGAPIVPVAIFGTRKEGESYEVRPPRGTTIDIIYGKPFWFAPMEWPRTTSDVDEATTHIHERLRAHVASASKMTDIELPGPAPDGETL